MKSKMTKLISMMLAFMMAVSLLPVSSVAAEVSAATGNQVYIYGGIATVPGSDVPFEGTVENGTVLSVALDESKFTGYTFSHWCSATGVEIPEKTFRVAVYETSAYYPVFTDMESNFGPWTMVVDFHDCEKGLLQMRKDEATGYTQYRVFYPDRVHAYEQHQAIDSMSHKATCKHCGKTVMQAHNFDVYWQNDVNTHIATCKQCGYAATFPHNWDKGTVVLEPTHTEEGRKQYICTTCGATKTEMIPCTKAHHFNKRVVITPSVDGKFGTCKYQCACGELTEETYSYLEPKVNGYFKDRFLYYDSYRSDFYSNTCHDEKYFHYVNSDGFDTYLFATRAEKDADQTFAMLFIDDPNLTLKPVYLTKSYGKGNDSHYGFDWTCYEYVKDFDGFLATLRDLSGARGFQFVDRMHYFANVYNEMRIPVGGALPSHCSVREVEDGGILCDCYEFQTADGQLVDYYYVDKATGATLRYGNHSHNIQQGFSLKKNQPIVTDAAYDGMTNDEKLNCISLGMIPMEIRTLAADSNNALHITLEKPHATRYRVHMEYPADKYEYADVAYAEFWNYYEESVRGCPVPDSITETDGRNLITLKFYNHDGNYIFDRWEIYDYKTDTWKLLSTEENYSMNYISVDGGNIVNKAITDICRIRSVSHTLPTPEPVLYTVRVESGYYTYRYGNYTDSAVNAGEAISLYATGVPQGKEIDYWEESVDGGAFVKVESAPYDYTVKGDTVVRPVLRDRNYYVNVGAQNGTVALKDSTALPGGQYKAGTVLHLTTAKNEGFDTFLGWYLSDYDKMTGMEVYVLLAETVDYDYTVPAEYGVNLVARWTDGTPAPSYTVHFVGGLGGGYDTNRVNVVRQYSNYASFMVGKDSDTAGKLAGATVVMTKKDGTTETRTLTDKEIEYGVEIFNNQTAEGFAYTDVTVTFTFAPCTEHEWDKGVVTKMPTATQNCEVKYTCKLCGETKTVVGTNIFGSNMDLGNTLRMGFYVHENHIAQDADYYAEITKQYADGREPLVLKIDKKDWKYNSRQGIYGIVFSGLYAKEMTDTITVQIFHADGTPAGDIWTDSMRDYAMRNLDEQSPRTRTMLVDMLYYGAAAQKLFGYHEDDPANSLLTDAQKAYGTDSVVINSIRETGEEFYGSSVQLATNIAFAMYFKGVTPDMYAVFHYVDHRNNSHTVRVEGSSFMKEADGVYGAVLNGLVIADVKQQVTCTVYNSDGSIYARAIDSIESYAASGEKTPGNIYEAIVKFGTSAYAYFH